LFEGEREGANRVAAVAALRSRMTLTLDELRTHRNRRLARVKYPKRVTIAAEIKRSATSKPDYNWTKNAAPALIGCGE